MKASVFDQGWWIAGAFAVIPAKAGMMPSTPMRLSLLTVIPAKAGIHGLRGESWRVNSLTEFGFE